MTATRLLPAPPVPPSPDTSLMPGPSALPASMSIGDLTFAVRQSERRRTVGITVDRDGSLLLHAPAGISEDALAAWAWSKRGWVFRKLAEKHLLLPASPSKEFVTGEGFDYLGRHYRLQLTDDPPGTGVKLERGRLRMPRTQTGAGDGAEAVMRWYRQRGAIWLPRRIRPWAERMGLRPGDLDIRDLGYRWGSLGKADRLNIHWAAMQLPVSLLDYVIVHELAHIEQPRHTPAFWATVERALPDYDRRRTRLATTGTTLWLG
jgi:predicted metal-dependent hydrolase